jgi:hypothetical protein
MTLLNPTLGVNYSALRFLLPYFALLWVDRVVGTSTRRLVRWGAPALAVAAVAAVTPEMGIALGVAIAGMAAFRWFRRPHAHGVHVPVLILGAIAVASAVILAQQGTIAAFAVGAFYLPILPGQPALVFISSVLLLSWATGQGIRTFETRDAALHVGWFIIAVALIVPAFGRADFAHMFWNGLGAIIGAIAVAGQRWRAGAFYFAAVATTFLIAVFAFTATYSLEPITDGMRRLVYGSEQRATMAATLIGRPPEKAKGRWQQIEEERARQQHAADVIAGFPKLAYSAILWGEGAEGIARSGNLVPVYSFPTRALTVSEFERDLADLEAADTMVMPTADYVACRTAAEGAEPGVDGIVMTVPHAVGSAEYYGQLAAFPVALHGRNQMLDSAASFGLVIERDWRAYKTVATYTILRRR